jgi:Bacterial regulatory protein, Fis family
MSDRENSTKPELVSPEAMSSATISSLLKVLAGILIKEADSLEKVSMKNNRKINFHDEVKDFECRLIERALSVTSGSQLKAALLLGMKKSTLNGKIKLYNISIKQFVQAQSRGFSHGPFDDNTNHRVSGTPNRVQNFGSVNSPTRGEEISEILDRSSGDSSASSRLEDSPLRPRLGKTKIRVPGK